jgi:acyl-CoA thioesterase-1
MERNMKRIVLLFLCLWLLSASAFGEEINIVALGASGTYGKGVARNEAFPSQIEAMLKAEGHNIRVTNAGISGNTTSDMVSRLDRDVPEGTQIVIFQPGSNDQRRSNKRHIASSAGDTSGNVETAIRRLKERRIEVILFQFSGGEGKDVAKKYGALFYGSIYRDVPKENILNDGQHLSPEGHAIVSKNMVPLIKQLMVRIEKNR